MLALLPDDRNTGSTSKAQPSTVLASWPRGGELIPCFMVRYSQIGWFSQLLLFLLPRGAMGEKVRMKLAVVPTATLLSCWAWLRKTWNLSSAGTSLLPFSLPAGSYHLERPPRHQLWLSPGEEEGRALPPAWQVGSGQKTPLVPWVLSPVLKEPWWKALGIQQALQICRWEEWEMWGCPAGVLIHLLVTAKFLCPQSSTNFFLLGCSRLPSTHSKPLFRSLLPHPYF